MKNELAMILLCGAVGLVSTPAALASSRPAQPTADVGTINCGSASQTMQMAISYFEAGSKAVPNADSSGAGATRATFIPVFEIHAPLESASQWGTAMDTGTRFSSCTIRVSGHGGPETLTFSDLMVTSVLSVGKRRNENPLPEYYTDVVFIAAPTGNPVPGGWDISGSKTQ